MSNEDNNTTAAVLRMMGMPSPDDQKTAAQSRARAELDRQAAAEFDAVSDPNLIRNAHVREHLQRFQADGHPAGTVGEMQVYERERSRKQEADEAEVERQYREDERAAESARVQALAAKLTGRAAKPRSDTDSKPPKREMWAYAPVPRAIIRDKRLTKVEKLVAVGIADAINPGPWNSDLHVDISHREIADRVGVSVSSVTMALERLKALGYITTEAMKGTAGTRVKFNLDALGISTT